MSCKIEFDAFAFQGPRDKQPVRLFYKGTFRRKLLQSSIVQIVGKIYEEQTGGGWRRRTQLVPIGTFVGRRRVMPSVSSQSRTASREDDDDDDEDETEGDDYDAYDDYDVYDHDEEDIID